MHSSGITSQRMPTEQEWARMSWRARERFLQRQRPEKPQPRIRPPQRKPAPEMMSDQQIRRCGSCGAWMMSICGTGCDS